MPRPRRAEPMTKSAPAHLPLTPPRCSSSGCLSVSNLVAFIQLNDAYKAKFGFPFVMAVKGCTRGEILAASERRLNQDAASEFRTALDAVNRIALFRLQEL